MKEIEELEKSQVVAEDLSVSFEKITPRSAEGTPKSKKKKSAPKQVKKEKEEKVDIDLNDLIMVSKLYSKIKIGYPRR